MKVMTCLNIGCPLGTGARKEGADHLETEPREDLRRVFYYSYHNDDWQMTAVRCPSGAYSNFHDLPPVILCYKLNGQWLSPKTRRPCVVVPEGYGFKSIKWLTHVVLTNLAHANDTYAEANNDIDSPLKTFAATLPLPGNPGGQAIPITGYAKSESQACRKSRSGSSKRRNCRERRYFSKRRD